MEKEDVLAQAKVGGWAIVRQKICSVNPKKDSLLVGLENYDGERLVFHTQVLSIEPPPETDAEKIARLEGELGQCKQDCADWEYRAKTKSPSKIEWLGGPRPISPDARAIVWTRNGDARLILAMGCRWDHDQSSHDIVAYMVLPS